MRIIGGSVGGRRLKSPPEGTRPTSDRVREGLFNSLAARLDFDGLHVLDLYAGSGALGLEALSRGAASALLVESGSSALRTLRSNIADLKLDAAVRNCAVATVLRNRASRRYDLVFSDPPYALDDSAVAADLALLVSNGWLEPDALVVVERSARSVAVQWPDGLVALKSAKYGETRIEMAQATCPSLSRPSS